MTDLPRLPMPMRAINRVGRLLERAGRQRPVLDPDRLMDAARARTGVDDDGGDAFQVRYRLFMRSLRTEARLTMMGRIMARQLIGRLLDNRLSTRAALAAAPTIAARPVDRPVFIVGFARTGTTLLHRLMTLTPALRAPRFWALLRPALPPGHAGEDDRQALAERMVQRAGRVAPHMQAIHALDPIGPEECYFLFQAAFAVPVSAQFDVPGYLDAVRSGDFAGPYRFHRSVLQLWQGEAAETRWVLKAPMHLHTLGALLDVYPDAVIIRTHRALSQVAGSCCSLYEHTRRLYSDDVDPHALGEGWLARWGEAIDHTTAVRASRLPDDRVIDVRYPDLVADPVGTLGRIHQRLGLEWTPDGHARVEAHLTERPKGRHGAHRYDLSRYGLSAEALGERFADYRARAGIDP